MRSQLDNPRRASSEDHRVGKRPSPAPPRKHPLSRASSEGRITKRSSPAQEKMLTSGQRSRHSGNIENVEDPDLKRFLFYRLLMQKYSQAVQQDKPPPDRASDSDIRDILDNLATCRYQGSAWEESKIRQAPLMVIRAANGKFPDTAAMARELYIRWEKKKDYAPAPLESSKHEEDIEDDSEDDSDASEDEIDDDHARSQIMRNIVRSGHSWKIADHSKKRDAKVFGHNGLEPGQWWPLQICALRDGAHGSKMAGISGTGDDGCYSVVVSGGKSAAHGHGDYKDIDNFETLWYSGTVALDKPGRDASRPVVTPGTNALITSGNSYRRHGEGSRPVRVLRAKGASKYAPLVGLRYDGLYWVVDYEQVGNVQNGYYRFQLKRIPGQPPYEFLKTRPNAAERNWFENRDQRTRY